MEFIFIYLVIFHDCGLCSPVLNKEQKGNIHYLTIISYHEDRARSSMTYLRKEHTLLWSCSNHKNLKSEKMTLNNPFIDKKLLTTVQLFAKHHTSRQYRRWNSIPGFLLPYAAPTISGSWWESIRGEVKGRQHNDQQGLSLVCRATNSDGTPPGSYSWSLQPHLTANTSQPLSIFYLSSGNESS